MHSYKVLSGAVFLFVWMLTVGIGHCQSSNALGKVIAIDSPAFIFSPGNWTGDEGRGGSIFRQTWYPGAYFRVTWTTQNKNPSASILLDRSEMNIQ